MKRIIDLLSWVAMALVVVAVALRWQPWKPAWVDYAAPVALAAIALLVVWAVAQGFSGRRTARYGTLTSLSVVVVLGILVAVNYIGSRQNKRWDLTANKQFSLSDQTRQVLQKLDAPLNVTVFTKETEFQPYKDKFKEYEYASSKVKTDYVDLDKAPALAVQNQIQAYGTILFKYKDRSERITTDSEQDITTAIIKVVQGGTKKVYFTQGHSEKDPTSAQRDGYKAIADALGHENYTVDKLVLAQTPAVPDDAAVVVVAGPKTDFLPEEIAALKAYLGKAGKLLLEVDPPARAEGPPLTALLALAHDWGIDIDNDIVIDGASSNPMVAIVATYPSHAITDRMRDLTGYPLARTVTVVSGGVNGHTAQAIAETGPQSLAKADVKDILKTGKISTEISPADKRGPLTLAAAVSATADDKAATTGSSASKPETRVVVFGDSDFVANNAIGLGGNQDMFLNTMGWLSQQENLISIRPKEPDDRRLTMTATQQTNVTLLSLFIIPGLVFVAGVSTWWRRR